MEKPMSFTSVQNDLTRGFFRQEPTWVLTFIDGERFKCIGEERTETGLTTTCYLTPLDAAIEAVYPTWNGRQHCVNVASEFSLGAFLDERGHRMVAAIHTGWPAHERRPLLHPNGRLGRSCRLMLQPLSVPPSFEVDKATLDAYHRCHEQAGLYARAEMVRDIRTWPLTRLRHIAVEAVDAMHTQSMAGHWMNATQLAIFDPKFGQ